MGEVESCLLTLAGLLLAAGAETFAGKECAGGGGAPSRLSLLAPPLPGWGAVVERGGRREGAGAARLEEESGRERERERRLAPRRDVRGRDPVRCKSAAGGGGGEERGWRRGAAGRGPSSPHAGRGGGSLRFQSPETWCLRSVVGQESEGGCGHGGCSGSPFSARFAWGGGHPGAALLSGEAAAPSAPSSSAGPGGRPAGAVRRSLGWRLAGLSGCPGGEGRGAGGGWASWRRGERLSRAGVEPLPSVAAATVEAELCNSTWQAFASAAFAPVAPARVGNGAPGLKGSHVGLPCETGSSGEWEGRKEGASSVPLVVVVVVVDHMRF